MSTLCQAPCWMLCTPHLTLPKSHREKVCIADILWSTGKRQRTNLSLAVEMTGQPWMIQWPRDLPLVIKAKFDSLSSEFLCPHAIRNTNPKETPQNILLTSHWRISSCEQRLCPHRKDGDPPVLGKDRGTKIPLTARTCRHSPLLLLLHKLFEMTESSARRCCLAAKVPNENWERGLTTIAMPAAKIPRTAPRGKQTNKKSAYPNASNLSTGSSNKQ